MSNIDLIVTKILDEAEILKFDSNKMFDEAIFFTVDKIYHKNFGYGYYLL